MAFAAGSHGCCQNSSKYFEAKIEELGGIEGKCCPEVDLRGSRSSLIGTTKLPSLAIPHLDDSSLFILRSRRSQSPNHIFICERNALIINSSFPYHNYENY